MHKPRLGFRQIFDLCFGFLGLQFGFALQNANVSRIFQSLGASLRQIPTLWIAAPLTGLLVQPIVGYWSDRTWTRLGRRRPYFLAGALLAAAALVAMPLSPALWVAALLLWLLDGSINVSMEPFRAFVGDQLAPEQRAIGYSMQSFFIGIGAVVASLMPWMLARAGVDNLPTGQSGVEAIPATVRWSFEIGAAVLFAAVAWTAWRSTEYSPQQLMGFDDAVPAAAPPRRAGRVGTSARRGLVWLAIGVSAVLWVRLEHFDPQLYLLGAGAAAWGLAQLLARRTRPDGMLASVIEDLRCMPLAMRRLIPVQFFSWLSLFAMWIYSTAAVAQVDFASTDPHSAGYNAGANWVGVLFGAYNGFAAVAAVLIPAMVRRLGLRASHLVNLALGGAGLLSFIVLRNPQWLLVSMIGVGFAWASILSLPYALLSDSVPAEKMGIYMGIFNFFIVIPQLVAASLLGLLLRTLFHGAPIGALGLGGAGLLVAGVLALRVPQPAAKRSAAPQDSRTTN
ncbi:MAG: MFS transporter [Gammaproteobacteria bacterium]|nr:MFS transporter [Gammaproteobacteria bacterium]